MAWAILSLVLSLSVAGGLVVILTFFVNLVFYKKINFKWHYYIWIVAIVRLLLPFAPEENLMKHLAKHIYNIVQTNVTSPDSANASKILSGQKEPDSFTLQDNTKTDTIKTSGNRQDKQTMQRNNILETIWNVKEYICIFWILITLLIFLYKVTVYRSFVKFVQAGSTPIDNISQLETLSLAEASLNIHNAVDLWVNPIIASPMLIGFFHPCIVLPNTSLSGQEFYYTILHELMHYKRKDMYYKWIIQAVTCIHWFNPLVYAAVRSINRLCELSCDEAVTARLESVKEYKEYAKTLLNAMAAPGVYKEHTATLTLSENKKLLKERLEAIMNINNNKKTIASTVLIAVLTVAITFTGIFTGSYTAGAANGSYSEVKKDIIKTQKGSANSKNDNITSAQADKIALALIDKIWVWEWIEFFVPYMSEKGTKKIIPASQNAGWAGSVDMTTGKKIKFTKKQINAARKHKPSSHLTCADIDEHALMIMQSNGDWECVSFMLPYMSHKGIRAVVRCYNSKHGGSGKKAEDYF